MIFVRAVVGGHTHFLVYDEHSEPWLLPRLQLAWNFPTRGLAHAAIDEAKKLPRFAGVELEVIGSEDPVSCSG